MRKAQVADHFIRWFVVLLCLLGAALWIKPIAAGAEEAEKVVRVGWCETPSSKTDENGRRSGYDYVYLQKLSAYTGWTYEYVEDSWPNLFQKLEDGEIDLMSDVSYTKERAKSILYPSLPMGTEDYYIFITPDNTEISQDNYGSLNGKKVGVNKGTLQEASFIEWAKENNINAKLVELTTLEGEAFEMLRRGDLDAYVSIDGYGDPEAAVPICKVGSSDYYFAVNKSRADLLEELDYALNRIFDENKYFNQQMHEKYVSSTGANLYLNTEEHVWLENHGRYALPI